MSFAILPDGSEEYVEFQASNARQVFYQDCVLRRRTYLFTLALLLVFRFTYHRYKCDGSDCLQLSIWLDGLRTLKNKDGEEDETRADIERLLKYDGMPLPCTVYMALCL